MPLYNALGDKLSIFGTTPFGLDVFTAGIVLAIMIIPIVSAISARLLEQFLILKEKAAYALGATRWEVVKTAILPYGKSGLLGSFLFGAW